MSKLTPEAYKRLAWAIEQSNASMVLAGGKITRLIRQLDAAVLRGDLTIGDEVVGEVKKLIEYQKRGGTEADFLKSRHWYDPKID